MAEATFPIRTIFRLVVPAEFTSSRARSEIESAKSAHKFIWCGRWFGAVTGFICMRNCHLLSVTSITNCYINRPTGIQCIVIYSVWSLIRMYLSSILVNKQQCHPQCINLLLFPFPFWWELTIMRKIRKHLWLVWSRNENIKGQF